MTDIFTPVVLVRDSEDKKETLVRDSKDKKETLIRDSEDKKETLVSYNDLFYKEGVPQKKTILLGEPGAGKTTFLKHLTDVWCNPTSKRQFDDVDVFQEYPFLFHISCRFAGKNETILDMIKHQLFDDEEMKDIACNVLKHFSNGCLILIDGFDELQRSALAETGKRGDITGLPSLIGVQNCVLIITSRPWKFFSIPKDEQEKFSRMELDGIKNVKELVEILFRKHQVPDPAKTSSDFLAEINERKMNKLIKYPLMLIFAIDVWVQNMSLPKSVCLCYINMIKLSLERSQTKCEKANMDNTNIVENLLNSSKSEESLPHVFSNFKCVQRHAGLFLSFGHLASDFLLGLKEQMLVFQKDDCEKYKISEDDGSLKLCLDLGLLTKLESTVRGIKQKETFQFCHKTFQEFFAALWLSRKYTVEDSQEKLNLHACLETDKDLLNYSVLLNFLCGFNPEAGTHFWTYIAQKDINLYYHSEVKPIQNLVLNTVKEAHNCCDHQGELVYYCIPHVCIDKYTSDEDVSLLFKMIIQNNCAYLKKIYIRKDICLLSSQYHSLLSCISSATNLTHLRLGSISCQTHGTSDRLPVVDLHKHHKLLYLILDKIPLSRLLLSSQEETQLRMLSLDKLSMSHDNLVQLCKSLLFLVGLEVLDLNDLSCSDHDGSCPLPVLGLDKHHKLGQLVLQKIPLSCRLLPSQEETQLRELYLVKLTMSHDNLVQLCKSLSFLVGLKSLFIGNLSCSDHDGTCPLPALGLQRHHKLWWLKLDNTSISGLLLPCQEESRIKYLNLHNLVLSHDSLVQLCSSISSSSVSIKLKLTNLRCYDHDDLTNLSCSAHSGRCPLPALCLDRHHELWMLSLDNTSISGLRLPGQEESQIEYLYLYNLVLSHDSLVQLCKSLSFLVGLKALNLDNISCSDNSGSCPLPVLGLDRHHKLRRLKLGNTSISGLLLPGQEESRIECLDLHNLVLSHDSLVQLCSSISSSSVLGELKLTNLRCYDHADLTNLSCSEHSGRCRLKSLNLYSHHELKVLSLDKISIRWLLLPSQDWLDNLELNNMSLSHDSLVQLCSTLSFLPALKRLKLTNLRCYDHDDRCGIPILDRPKAESENVHMEQIPVEDLSALSSLENLQLTMVPCSEHSVRCNFTVLDLHEHYRLEFLELDTSSISGIILPRPERHIINAICLRNLVLSHYSLQQLCTSVSALSASGAMLQLTNLSCSDHSGSCFFPFLSLQDTELSFLNIFSDTVSADDFWVSDFSDSD